MTVMVLPDLSGCQSGCGVGVTVALGCATAGWASACSAPGEATMAIPRTMRAIRAAASRITLVMRF
jgi:hypothetical protein